MTDDPDPLAEALQLRHALQRLLAELAVAETLQELERIRVEMSRVGPEYQAALQAATVAMRAANDQLEAKLRQLQREHRPD